jgi:hypothetical protein
MMSKFVLALLLACACQAQNVPVVVELFTSEGCSSCPPADALLEQLDRTQPVDGAHIVVLGEHVDYWDHQGWRDPHSSAAFTARQHAYALRFARDPYTPQIVVDGRTEVLGNDRQAVLSGIKAEAREPRLALRIVPEEGGSKVRVEADPLPAGKLRKAELFVARALDSGASDVLRGENSGRKLHHVAIVTDLRQVGKVDQREPLRVAVAVPATGTRLIAFVQEPGTGRILGAADLAAK